MFIEHVELAVSRGLLTEGGMFDVEEDVRERERKFRHSPLQKGLNALRGLGSEEDQRLLFRLAALYHDLKIRGDVPIIVTTQGDLSYNLAPLLKAIAENLDRNREPRVKDGKRTEAGAEERDDVPRKKELKPDFEIACEAADRLTPEQQLALATRLVEKFAAKAQNRTIPDLSHIPRWRGSKIDSQPLAYIEEHYGTRSDLLEKGIYREDIIGHDPRLIGRASDEARRRGHKLRHFVPNQSDAIDKIALPLGFNEEGKAVAGVALVIKSVFDVLGAMAGRRQRERQKHPISRPALQERHP